MTESRLRTSDLIRIAWRNIARNRRRTTLNVIALTISMTIMVIALGWVRGYFSNLYEGMMRLDTGHLQILHRDYLDQARRVPLDLTVTDHRPLAETLRTAQARGLPAFTAIAGRIEYEVEVGNGREYMPMRGRAVEPEHEQQITTIQHFIIAGAYLQAHAEGVLIGTEAAALLGVGPGDTVFLRVRDRFGAPNTVAVPVAGVFRTGYPLFDRFLVISALEPTTVFLRTEGVTHLVARAPGRINPTRTAAAVQETLPDHLRAYPWQRFARTMIAAVEADIGAFTMLMGVLFLLILLGILNSMSMTVRERGREIGTMRAIGLKRAELRNLLLAESAIIALLSAVAATICGGAAAAYIQTVGFDIASNMPAELAIPFGDRFYGDYRALDFIAGALAGTVVALLGSLIPARRAMRRTVAEALIS